MRRAAPPQEPERPSTCIFVPPLAGAAAPDTPSPSPLACNAPPSTPSQPARLSTRSSTSSLTGAADSIMYYSHSSACDAPLRAPKQPARPSTRSFLTPLAGTVAPSMSNSSRRACLAPLKAPFNQLIFVTSGKNSSLSRPMRDDTFTEGHEERLKKQRAPQPAHVRCLWQVRQRLPRPIQATKFPSCLLAP